MTKCTGNCLVSQKLDTIDKGELSVLLNVLGDCNDEHIWKHLLERMFVDKDTETAIKHARGFRLRYYYELNKRNLLTTIGLLILFLPAIVVCYDRPAIVFSVFFVTRMALYMVAPRSVERFILILLTPWFNLIAYGAYIVL